MADRVVENTIPVLAVANVPASIRFYRDVLGFKVDWTGDGDAPQIGSVSRDGHAIMLRQSDSAPSWVWIGVDTLAPFWNKVRSNPEIIVERPTNQPWALEMQIRDPDGNVLWFGMEPKSGVPFGAVVDQV